MLGTLCPCGGHTPGRAEPSCPFYTSFSHLSVGLLLGHAILSFNLAHVFGDEESFSLLCTWGNRGTERTDVLMVTASKR